MVNAVRVARTEHGDAVVRRAYKIASPERHVAALYALGTNPPRVSRHTGRARFGPIVGALASRYERLARQSRLLVCSFAP
jgi:hypothetical protein